jgi:molybdate transport system substrate-binding protein
MRASRGRRAATILLVLLLGWCAPARAAELLAFAAASLTDAMTELGKAFEQRSGDTVRFSFGASSDLARQIQAGAPANVFFSADAARMDQLEQAGLVDKADRRDVLSNDLVVIVPADAKTTITGPADLTKLEHLALANPDSVPAGVYARTWLQSLGFWDRVKDKVVPTVDVRAALAAVDAGHAEAGIVYATDAAITKGVRVAYRVPREQAPPIVYVLAPLKTSKNPAARELVRFLASHDAAATYQRLGFIVLPGT